MLMKSAFQSFLAYVKAWTNGLVVKRATFDQKVFTHFLEIVVFVVGFFKSVPDIENDSVHLCICVYMHACMFICK